MSEPNPMCTCELEPAFGVCPDGEEPRPWIVIDAEGEEIAVCREERFAALIANSLDNVTVDDGPLDGDGWGGNIRACLVHPRKP
jgi:hypothetical protein